MEYPRKPRCFKSAYQIEVDRRKAITAAYQTLYKELYEENKKLRKSLAQIQRDHFHATNTFQYLETTITHQNETIERLNNKLKGKTK